MSKVMSIYKNHIHLKDNHTKFELNWISTNSKHLNTAVTLIKVTDTSQKRLSSHEFDISLYSLWGYV